MKKSFQIQIIQRIISALNNFKEKSSERELKKHDVTISRLTSLKRLPLALMEGKIQLYGLKIETIRLDFKSGLEALLKEKPTKAIFLGTRIGDPNAVGQEQFSPSSPGWPPFMRVNPILDWSYRLFLTKLAYT
ncbi:hypothetical protein IFM89_038958 [Coptis chinensis]|uniref:Uncharacterized protein n=1 Tax=Coptis chinensis TaxID=261450 RepID=A0A835MBQ8_9MAGN|nr:hypothetical protein IFM89_038958 [Coptis chinensis]